MSTNIILEHNSIIKAIPNTYFRAQALSVEDSEVVSKVADYFSNKLKIAGDILINSVNRLYETNSNGVIGNSELRKYKNTIQNIQTKTKYNNVSAVQIPVTLGMKKDLYSSVTDILNIVDVLKKDVPETIDKLDTTVSKMLSNDMFRKSNRPFKDDSMGIISNRLNKTIDELIDPTGVNDRMPVSKLLPNLSSLSSILEMLTVISDLVDKKTLKNIIKQSKGISDNIDYLYNEYKNNNTEVKKERLIELGYHLEEGAKIITTYVSIIHIINQFNNTFDHLLKALDK